MGVPDFLILDPSLPTLPLALRSEVYPGFGAFLRHRRNTPGESYLAFCAGDFMFDQHRGLQPFPRTGLQRNSLAWQKSPSWLAGQPAKMPAGEPHAAECAGLSGPAGTT